MTVSLSLFTDHYRGRHRPDDAAWWLEHPDVPGPSGQPPTQRLFLQAADELTAAGLHDAATAMLDVLGHLLDNDRRHALDALRAANRPTTS